MKFASYWQETAAPFARAEAGPVEGRVDVAVVGAGFAGLSAALALAERGASVRVLEAGTVAGGASGRNGGHVNNGTAHDFAALAASRGPDAASAIYRAFDDAVDTVERLVTTHQIQCDFRRCGKIKLAAKPAHYEKLARALEALRGVDPETELVPPARIRDEVGSDRFHGGLLHRKSAQMHMGRFATGLAEAAWRAGARIHERCRVTGVRRTAAGHVVTTQDGTVQARHVLLATGASRRGPFGWVRRRIVPVGSFIVATAPLSRAQLDSIMPTRRNATTTLNVGHYFRISPDDRLIWGGRTRFALPGPGSDAKSGRVLERTLHETFPQLGRPAIDYCWGGVVDMTADRLPRAGERDGIHYALGFSGHGTQMSVHLGERMARVLAGEAEVDPFRGAEWRAIPGHFGPPWFMPIVGAYYRWQDWRH